VLKGCSCVFCAGNFVPKPDSNENTFKKSRDPEYRVMLRNEASVSDDKVFFVPQ